MEEDNNNLDMALNTDNNIAVESDEENEERQGVDKMLKLLRSNNFQHLLGLFLNMLLHNYDFFLHLGNINNLFLYLSKGIGVS